MHTHVPGIGKGTEPSGQDLLPSAASHGRASTYCFSKDLVLSLRWIRVGNRCELGGKKHHADKRKKETVPGIEGLY